MSEYFTRGNQELEEEERIGPKGKKKFNENVRRLQIEMEQRAGAHHLCAEHYGQLRTWLFGLFLVVGGASAGCVAMFNGWKVLWSPKSAIAIFVLAFATFVIERVYSWANDSHEKHYKEKKKCQNIAERAQLLCDSSESMSSRERKSDELFQEKAKFKASPHKWATEGCNPRAKAGPPTFNSRLKKIG